ncbi:uncharacterized protein LOC132203723 [Neocloeon triangulifer]|uniref:uncharacterized protein LOC132203723 n=1 Tax=Neocloeon triangulifer TaxID=2078957 RepID=UPI00286F1390|nr:uncharacterized protein LOC132203723 [Neocloeon triangulifer]
MDSDEFDFLLPELIMEFNNVQMHPRRRFRFERPRFAERMIQEEVERARAAVRENTLINVPFCSGTVGTLKNELVGLRKTGKTVATLEMMSANFILQNQAYFCHGRHSVGNLSPSMQRTLVKAILNRFGVRDSPVYFDFLSSLLNSNTWMFNDYLISYSMNYLAIQNLLLDNCCKLQELYLNGTTSANLIYLRRDFLPNLQVLHCPGFTLDNRDLEILSGLTHLRDLMIEIEASVGELGVSHFSKLKELEQLKYRVVQPYLQRGNGIDERIAVLFFKYVPQAHISLMCDVQCGKVSYALWTFFQHNPVRPMGQKCVRLVDMVDQHRDLGRLLPKIESLYIANKFQEFTPETIGPLLHFPQLSQLSFSNTSVHLCHLFFEGYGQQLVELSIKECFTHTECTSDMDLSLLFAHCPNLQKVSLCCNFSQELNHPLRQTSFDALHCIELVSYGGREPPSSICEMVLKGKSLQSFLVTAELLNLVNAVPDDFRFNFLNMVSFRVSDSGEEGSVQDIQNGLLKLVFLSPKLEKLAVNFGDHFAARQACLPVKYVCQGVLKIEFL